MVDKSKLKSKQVILKIEGLEKPVQGTVTHVESDGLWITSSAFSDALLKEAGVNPGWLKLPVVFVPTSKLRWLVASNE